MVRQFFKTQFVALRKQLLADNFFALMFYYQRVWQPKPNSLEAFLEDYSANKKDFFFLQVGGNDGFQNDPICKFVKRHRWAGITVEPQAAPFRTLQEIYKKDAVTPINAAIDVENRTRKLYKVAFTDARWASGISSFLRSHLEQKIEDGYIERKARKSGIELPENKENWIAYDEVQCLTFGQLFDDCGVRHLDLLQIDTEGFDYEILKMFPFERLMPKILIFERENLSQQQQNECNAWLAGLGYSLKTFAGDTVGLLQK